MTQQSIEELRDKLNWILYDVENYALNDPTRNTNEFVNTKLDEMLALFSSHLQAIRGRLPEKWETPERRTAPSNRQLGFNECLSEVDTLLASEISKLKGETE